jgi:colicin import membrane protein
LALVDRAAPFPPPPPGAQQSFSAEVGFGLEEAVP